MQYNAIQGEIPKIGGIVDPSRQKDTPDGAGLASLTATHKAYNVALVGM